MRQFGSVTTVAVTGGANFWQKLFASFGRNHRGAMVCSQIRNCEDGTLFCWLNLITLTQDLAEGNSSKGCLQVKARTEQKSHLTLRSSQLVSFYKKRATFGGSSTTQGREYLSDRESHITGDGKALKTGSSEKSQIAQLPCQ